MKPFKWIEPTEKEIENAVLTFLNYHPGCFAFKVNTVGIYDAQKQCFRKPSKFIIPGTPDILCCYHGRFIGFEVKSKRGVQSPQQKSFQARLEQHKGLYFIIRCVEDAQNVLKSL